MSLTISPSDGCGSTHAEGSYGSAFNKGKGGVYATYLESDALKIYWFPRQKIPADIKAGKPDPSKWGKPASQFISGSSCKVDKYFKGQTIVRDCKAKRYNMLTQSLDHQHCFLWRQHRSGHLERRVQGFYWGQYLR
jgi:hypothetical protein